MCRTCVVMVGVPGDIRRQKKSLRRSREGVDRYRPFSEFHSQRFLSI